MASGRSTAQQHNIHPSRQSLCLTYPNKLRNVTQHKSGLVWSWRQASVSEPQRSRPRRPPHSPRDKPNCSHGAAPCAVLCCIVAVLIHAVVLRCLVVPRPSSIISVPTRPEPCHLGQLTLTAEPVGCAPQTLGSCIVGSHQASPHHRCIKWRWWAEQPCWQARGVSSHGHRFRPKDAALERVLDSLDEVSDHHTLGGRAMAGCGVGRPVVCSK